MGRPGEEGVVRERGWPDAKLISRVHLRPKPVQSWLSIEIREAAKGRFLVVRRMVERFDGAEWTGHRGFAVRLDEIAGLLKALRESATEASKGDRR